MAIQVGGTNQTRQVQKELDDLTRKLERSMQMAQQYTDAVQEAIRTYIALGYGADIGAASADEFLTASSGDSGDPRSRRVSKIRAALKANLSLAVLRGDLAEADANAMLQEVTGDGTETVAAAGDIISLVNEWV
jgi:hypothetical protein